MKNSEARQRICPFAMAILNRVEGPPGTPVEPSSADAYGYRNCQGDDCIAWEREEGGDEEGFCRAFPTYLKYDLDSVITSDPKRDILEVLESEEGKALIRSIISE